MNGSSPSGGSGLKVGVAAGWRPRRRKAKPCARACGGGGHAGGGGRAPAVGRARTCAHTAGLVQVVCAHASVVYPRARARTPTPARRGWGHNWPGHFLPSDRVGHWSDRQGKPGGMASMDFEQVGMRCGMGRGTRPRVVSHAQACHGAHAHTLARACTYARRWSRSCRTATAGRRTCGASTLRARSPR